MERYTQRELKRMVGLGLVENITNADNAERNKIIEIEGYLEQIGYSSGTYGCNGALFRGNNTGKYYAITSRTTAIYIFC